MTAPSARFRGEGARRPGEAAGLLTEHPERVELNEPKQQTDLRREQDRSAGMIALVGWVLAATHEPNATMRTVVAALSAEYRLA